MAHNIRIFLTLTMVHGCYPLEWERCKVSAKMLKFSNTAVQKSQKSVFKRPDSLNLFLHKSIFHPQMTQKHFFEKFYLENMGKMTLKKVAGSQPLQMALNKLKNIFSSNFFTNRQPTWRSFNFTLTIFQNFHSGKVFATACSCSSWL